MKILRESRPSTRGLKPSKLAENATKRNRSLRFLSAILETRREARG